MRGLYMHACPNCGGIEGDDRLLQGLPCLSCLPRPVGRAEPEEIGRTLKERGVLKGYKFILELERRYREIEELFRRAVGGRMWSAQRTWVKRVLLGKSFSIIAPTGVGKTTFGLVMALYYASRGKKTYIVLPTTPLVLQAEEKARNMAEKAGVKARILAIHAKLAKKQRDERLEALASGDFDVLITTSRFLQARFDEVSAHTYAFIFVDDVDAVLKSSKSVDLILKLVGFTDEDIELGVEAIRTRIQLMRKLSSAKSREELEDVQKAWQHVEERLRKARRRARSILVVSSATGRPRGARVKLFRELLGFEAGSRSEILRRIIDTYYIPGPEGLEEAVARIVERLGTGGLVYVPVDRGIEYAERLAEYLRSRGIKAEAFHSKKLKALDLFVEGDVDVLVGVAVYYGVMVRGLDLPQRVRYAVFAGIPRLKFSTEFEEPHPISILRALTILVDVAPEDLRHRLEVTLVRVRRALQRLSPAAIQVIAERMREGQPPAHPAETVFHDALELVREALARRDVREALKSSGEIAVVEEDGRTYVLIPDVMTYIQASGRTSRMYAGGITRGLSVVVVDDERLFRGLETRSRWVVEDVRWEDFGKVNLDDILREIDEDREKVRKVISGEIPPEYKDLIRTVLLVVESPNKARTIANFFGKPSVRSVGEIKVYEVSTGDYLLLVTASGGHVYDLVSEPVKTPVNGEYFHGVVKVGSDRAYRFFPIYTSLKRCLMCGYQFTLESDKCPRCGSPFIRNSYSNIEAIRELALEVDEVLIGTDPDTEGEKIGWDLAVLLKPYTRRVARIEFHEVTRRAILEALKNPRDFDRHLVEAQIVRRVEDRWIGFTLSPMLWYRFWPAYCEKHVKNKELCKRPNRNLSAGRVQTPVLGWIVGRHEEWRRSIKRFYQVGFDGGFVELSEDELGGEKLSHDEVVVVEELGREVREVKPLPPYTTDALLTEASSKLRLSAPETMRLAQDLFEMGFITYHRTDSTRVSDAGIGVAKTYLSERYGDKLREVFAPRSWGEGGAHEAIRPTRPFDAERLRRLIEEGIIQPVRPLTRRHLQLYDMIFRRFIASQMKPGKVEVQKARIKIRNVVKEVERYIRVLEPGFLEIYTPFALTGELRPGTYRVQYIHESRRATKPLYSQGDVVKLMKERGIGRPSTYAKILQTLLARRYVLETGRLKKLVPTSLGREVYKYLTQGDETVSKLVSEERTALLENMMDQVERGEKDYQEVLKELYQEILPVYERVKRLMEEGGSAV